MMSVLQIETLKANSTFDYSSICGRNTCPDTKLPIETSRPNKNSVYYFLISLCVLSLTSMLLTVLFIDNRLPKRHEEPKTKISLRYFC